MTKPYLIISDTHAHSWSAFSRTLDTGVNSRLQSIIDAHHEAVATLKAKGGVQMFHAGDAFHVRGRVEPSVLTPTMDMYRELTDSGLDVIMLPGNHDLEGNDSTRIGNAVTALESVGVTVAHKPIARYTDFGIVAIFPWYSNVDDLVAAMAKERKNYKTGTLVDAIIHAPIDKVLPHLPDHGLSAESLADLGYNRVFSGHYHNHKDMGRGVYSIGALTHQTFGDIDSKAGYLLVYPDRVEHYETKAPKFVDVTGGEKPSELAAKIKGNFVRCRVEISSDKELNELRMLLLGAGAADVVVMPIKKITTNRAATTTAGATIETSISEYAKRKSFTPDVQKLCLDILNEARASE